MMDELKEDEKLDGLLRDLAQDYNAPPPAPRAELWERIAAARRDSELARRSDLRNRFGNTARWGLALAALLLLGIAIGRMTAPGVPGERGGATPGSTLSRDVAAGSSTTTTDSQVVANAGGGGAAPRGAPGAERRERTNVAGQLVMAQHLGHVETFLIDFNSRRAAQEFAGQAEDLLGTTRLLLDSKHVTDVGARKLLEDLELILAQIAALSGDRSEELDLIKDDLAQQQLRARLRSAMPSGSAIRM